MKRATRPPLRRIVRLDVLLRNHRYPNARTAARELEVHPRTVHHDLAFMRDSFGAPLAFDARKNGFYYSDPQYTLPLVQVSEGELLALFLAERLLQQYRGTPFACALAAAFGKRTAGLPSEGAIVRNPLPGMSGSCATVSEGWYRACGESHATDRGSRRRRCVGLTLVARITLVTSVKVTEASNLRRHHPCKILSRGR